MEAEMEVKMEAKMEVSKPESYYSTKSSFCKRKKGIVCGKVATVLELLNLRPLPPQIGKIWKFFLLSWIISRYRLLFAGFMDFLSDIVVPRKCTFGS